MLVSFKSWLLFWWGKWAWIRNSNKYNFSWIHMKLAILFLQHRFFGEIVEFSGNLSSIKLSMINNYFYFHIVTVAKKRICAFGWKDEDQMCSNFNEVITILFSIVFSSLYSVHYLVGENIICWFIYMVALMWQFCRIICVTDH